MNFCPLSNLRAAIILEKHLGHKSVACFGKCNVCMRDVEFVQIVFPGETPRERFVEYFESMQTDCQG